MLLGSCLRLLVGLNQTLKTFDYGTLDNNNLPLSANTITDSVNFNGTLVDDTSR